MCRIIVLTGDGKGKTTSAFGTVLRAAGHGQDIYIMQFIKSNKSGEVLVLNNIDNIEITQCGRGFVKKDDSEDFPLHVQAAKEGLKAVSERIAQNCPDVLVLDEVLGAIGMGLVGESEIIEIIENLNDKSTIILTGRGASKRIIKIADTVTEMNCIKHGFEAGINAQKGVEF
jgi:cob(I)alamin adenosyltransferase